MLISKFDTNEIEKKIEEFENKLQISLPEEYIKFMTKYNGGKTPETEFRISKVNCKISSDVNGFYGMGQVDEDYSFDRLMNNQLIEEFIEDEMIPIATNVWGDYITMGIEKKQYGKIFFLYHDRKKKYLSLCKDLNEFISKCKSEKIEHIRTIEERKQNMIENGYGDMITEESIKGWQEEIDWYAEIHQEEVVF
ncbi:MAG: SMI1/KNR4 family protein [Clostridiales bacterium]|nr:SMI1/KNR4 family protein [Clostridiales bacterium]